MDAEVPRVMAGKGTERETESGFSCCTNEAHVPC